MNNENFIKGGITDANPVIFIKLSDDTGINVAGNSIGHDLTGVLDENTQNTYVLNDFYESELDDYTKGTVRYPLFNLEEGKYQSTNNRQYGISGEQLILFNKRATQIPFVKYLYSCQWKILFTICCLQTVPNNLTFTSVIFHS